MFRLKLLQDRCDIAASENISRQQENWQAVDGGGSGAGHHIRCARADRRGTREGLQAVTGLREGRRDVHHRLFIAGLVVTELGHLLQPLTHARDIPMAEDAKAPGKKGVFSPVTLHILVFEKGNNGLSHRQAFGGLLGHVLPPYRSRDYVASTRTHRGLE